MSELNIILGPMYSGKSTELLRIYNKYKEKYRILVINHISDNRYGKNKIYTHNKDSINCLSLLNLSEFYNYIESTQSEFDIILIDEAQFFNDLYDFCKSFTDIPDKIIYIFGLSSDYKREKFGQVIDLIPFADDIKHLKGICKKCKYNKEAPFTLRLNSKTEQVLVGCENEYISVCRDCWLKNK
jgi:thymidine kinase|tara:strand:- start:7388 stop:7939 length:552 start_codon:yes stop_codon:yes gene_type:complete